MRFHQPRAFLTVLLGILPVVVASAQDGRAQNGKGGGPAPKLPIAVVDMEKAAPHAKAFKIGRGDLDKMQDQFNKSLGELSMQINNLKMKIELMQESRERFQKELEREVLIGKQRLARSMYKEELDRQQAINDEKIYVELSGAIGELAAKRGILLVLRRRRHVTVDEMIQEKSVRSRAQGLQRQVLTNRARNVIYHAPSLDLTDDLIKYLKAK